MMYGFLQKFWRSPFFYARKGTTKFSIARKEILKGLSKYKYRNISFI
jgi:hypothetical protein